MNRQLNFSTTLDWFIALLATLAALAVLQTFVIGKHYIIPTMLLVVAVLLGNLGWYGLQNARWAKLINFWCGFLLSAHCFFALFWSVKYRTVLGDHFEWVCSVVTLLFTLLTYLYARHNRLFSREG